MTDALAVFIWTSDAPKTVLCVSQVWAVLLCVNSIKAQFYRQWTQEHDSRAGRLRENKVYCVQSAKQSSLPGGQSEQANKTTGLSCRYASSELLVRWSNSFEKPLPHTSPTSELGALGRHVDGHNRQAYREKDGWMLRGKHKAIWQRCEGKVAGV